MNTNLVPLDTLKKMDERFFPELLKTNCNILCKNIKNGKLHTKKINLLYDNDNKFWVKEKSPWSYFVTSEIVNKITDILKNTDLEIEAQFTEYDEKFREKELSFEKELYNEYQILSAKRPEERIFALSEALLRINKVINTRTHSTDYKADTFIKVSSYSFLVNKITIDEALTIADKNAKKTAVEISSLTDKIVTSLISILSNDSYIDSYFFSLIGRSNGVTVRHMIRTFVMSYRFLLYFNKNLKHNNLEKIINKNFNKKYRDWYSFLLPHLSKNDLSLDIVFKGGMRPVPEKEIKVFSAGFLLHDIGKQRYIDYYEGNSDFDKRKVESHAKTGYRMLLQKTVYSEKIAAIAGYHHEYYGHESGYGYYRELCSLMLLDNCNYRQSSCISYNLEDLQQFNTLSYLPVKLLEIVDVYDAITDPCRSYKSSRTPSETLKFMRKEFVDNNQKIDIILFDLFENFLEEMEN